MRFCIALATILILGSCLVALAEVPQIISYQGRLTDASGEPVGDDLYILEFRIYGSEAGADLLWSSAEQKVDIAEGLFTYNLGSNTPFPKELFTTAGERYLAIVVSGEPESTPRIRLVAGPYSLQASVASDLECYECITSTELDDDAVTASKLANNAVLGSNVIDGSLSALDLLDNVGLATSFESSVTIQNDVTTIDSVIISVPAPGYVLIIASGWLEMLPTYSHLLGNARFTVVTRADYMYLIDVVVGYANRVMSSTTYEWHNLCFSKVFEADTAGYYRYYFNGDRGYDSGTVNIRYVRMTAAYVPLLYGGTDKMVADGSGYDLTEAETVTYTDNTSPDGATVTGHVVDLRQFEVNALRKRLEAEKAENELLRARLKSAGN